MIVVSDSSPLILLAKIGRLELLREVYGGVLIPEAVHRETTRSDRPGAREILDADWIERAQVKDRSRVATLRRDLHEGEAEAIALAVERYADVILLDEEAAREKAREAGLFVTGSLGVAIEAKKQGHVASARPVLEALRNSGLWVSDAVFDRALRLAGE